MSLNLVVGVAMIASGVILAGYLLWQAAKYRNRNRDLRRNS